MPAFSTDVTFTNLFAGIDADRVKGSNQQYPDLASANAFLAKVRAGQVTVPDGFEVSVLNEPCVRSVTLASPLTNSHICQCSRGSLTWTVGLESSVVHALSVIPTTQGVDGDTAVVNGTAVYRRGIIDGQGTANTWEFIGQTVPVALGTIYLSSYGVGPGENITAALYQASQDALAQQKEVVIDFSNGRISAPVYWPSLVKLRCEGGLLGFTKVFTDITDGQPTLVLSSGDRPVIDGLWVSSGTVQRKNTVGVVAGGFKFWANNLTLEVGEIVVSNNVRYLCTTAGTIGTTQISGTGDNLSGGGTARFSTNNIPPIRLARPYRSTPFTPAVNSVWYQNGRYYRATAVTGATAGAIPTTNGGVDGGVTWARWLNYAELVKCAKAQFRFFVDGVAVITDLMQWESHIVVYGNNCDYGVSGQQMHSSTLDLSIVNCDQPGDLFFSKNTTLNRVAVQGTQTQPWRIDFCQAMRGNIYLETVADNAFPSVLVGGFEKVDSPDLHITGVGFSAAHTVPYVRFDSVNGGDAYVYNDMSGPPIIADKTGNATNFFIHQSNATPIYDVTPNLPVTNLWPNPYCQGDALQGPDGIFGPGRETISVNTESPYYGRSYWTITATPGQAAGNYKLIRVARQWLIDKIKGKKVTIAALVRPSGTAGTTSALAQIGYATNAGVPTTGSFVLKSGVWNVHGYVVTLPSNLTSLDIMLAPRFSGTTAGAGETLDVQAIYLVEGDQLEYLRANPLGLESANPDYALSGGSSVTRVDSRDVSPSNAVAYRVGDRLIIGGVPFACTLAGSSATAHFRRVLDVAAPTESSIKCARFGNSIWYYGDSDFYATADSSNYLTLTTLIVRGTGPAVTAAGTGTLEYRASDSNFRWTAPGDTAGPWTPFNTTRIKIQSGSADRWLLMFQNANVPLPAADVTISVQISLVNSGPVTGILGTGPETRGAFNWLEIIANQPWRDAEIVNCCAGGQTSAGLVNAIPLFENMLPTSGPWLAILGDIITNDVSAVSVAGNMPAALTALKNNITTWLDWVLARGASAVEMVGANPRYKTGTTALDAHQLQMTLAADEFLKAIAAANPSRIHYTPIYPALVDAALNPPTGAPIANSLVDHVHHNVLGAFIAGREVAKSPFIPRGSVGRVGDPRSRTVGFNGSMQASTAATGTGASGVQPATITATFNRATGTADFVGVGSFVPRDDGAQGNLFRMALSWTTTATGSIWEYRFRGLTLAELGKAVGDEVFFELDARFDNCVNVASIQVWMGFIGAAGTQRSYAANDGSIFITKTFPINMTTVGRLRSYAVKIPAGTTQVNTYVWVTTGGANGSADVYLANFDVF